MTALKLGNSLRILNTKTCSCSGIILVLVSLIFSLFLGSSSAASDPASTGYDFDNQVGGEDGAGGRGRLLVDDNGLDQRGGRKEIINLFSAPRNNLLFFGA